MDAVGFAKSVMLTTDWPMSSHSNDTFSPHKNAMGGRLWIQNASNLPIKRKSAMLIDM